jgi:hypothetical protein
MVNGVAQPSQQDIVLTPSQLAQTTYQAGSGPDVVWVEACDGTTWSDWKSFTVTGPIDSGPVVTPTQTAIVSTQGQIFAGSSLFGYSDPFGSPATEYDVADNGGGGGRFLLNGSPLPATQDNFVTAAQLSQLTYEVGSGTDTLWVRANDGTVWGAWSNGFTISDPTTIANGQTLELPSAFAGKLGFEGPTGVLQLDQSSSFSGTVAGFAGQDRIDLADIAFGSHTSLAYQADSTGDGGTLSVSDGLHAASVMLLGQYAAANFALAADAHGGTVVTTAAVQPLDLHASA